MNLRPALPPRALVALLIAAVVPLAGCAGKPPPAAGSTSSSGSASGASDAATQRLEVTVAHGKASGNTGRVKVATGTAVTLVVTSDTADEVHVHGYDIEKELAPGKPTTLRFTADVPGVFEVELHKANLVILRLQVG
ncbi:MAG: cupredoxin domain-containing protein [Blastococcus sp.]